MSTRATSWIPVTVDVPFATAIMGFRPRSLPPLAPGELGVELGHIHGGHWAERIGLKEGDTITHVNGRSVTAMRSSDEFLQAVSTRPLRLTVQLSVSSSELSDVLQSFDWSSRLTQIEKTRDVSRNDPKQTDEIFERVFTNSPSPETKSGLFDFSKWIGTPKPSEPSSEPATIPSKPAESIPIESVKPKAPPLVQVPLQPADPPPKKELVQKKLITTLKWISSSPLCIRFKIEQGFNLPARAGTLGLDYYLQPFSAEPFLEVSLVTSPGRDVTMNEILDSKPIEPGALLQTPICDSESRWDYAGSLSLTSEAFTEADVMLVGKLMDYRRLEAARPMGVFAIRLDALEISDDISKVKPSMIALSLIDPTTFDVSKTRIRMSLCLKGRQVTHSEAIRVKTNAVESVKSSPKSSPSLLSATSESDNSSEIGSPSEQDAPLLKTTIQEKQIPYQTPFQRAYQKAVSDIKRGDNSAIRNQRYTLR